MGVFDAGLAGGIRRDDDRAEARNGGMRGMRGMENGGSTSVKRKRMGRYSSWWTRRKERKKDNKGTPSCSTRRQISVPLLLPPSKKPPRCWTSSAHGDVVHTATWTCLHMPCPSLCMSGHASLYPATCACAVCSINGVPVCACDVLNAVAPAPLPSRPPLVQVVRFGLPRGTLR